MVFLHYYLYSRTTQFEYCQDEGHVVSCRCYLFILDQLYDRCSSPSVSSSIFFQQRFDRDWCRVKLHHMESAHDQLFKVGSHDAIAFTRKYGINGPIPESLTNYLDVRYHSGYCFNFDFSHFQGSILWWHWYWNTSSILPCCLRVSDQYHSMNRSFTINRLLSLSITVLVLLISGFQGKLIALSPTRSSLHFHFYQCSLFITRYCLP